MAQSWWKEQFTAPMINYLGKRKMKRLNLRRPPIFIGGCGRSGTTLLLSILDAHPHIYAFPHEVTTFGRWKASRSGGWEPERMDRFYKSILRASIPRSAERFCEKTPRNVRHIEEIFSYFEQEARFIHLIRDGRDVLLSRHPDNPEAYWVAPETWVQDVKSGLAYRDDPRVFTVFYEDLIRDYQATVKALLEFLEEPYTGEMKDWYQHTAVRQNRAWQGPLEKLHGQSIQKWKRSTDTKRLQEIQKNDELTALLRHLNYET